jgi:hypothetical protein
MTTRCCSARNGDCFMPSALAVPARPRAAPCLQLARVPADAGLDRFDATLRRGPPTACSLSALSRSLGGFGTNTPAWAKAGVRLALTWRPCRTLGLAPPLKRTRSQSGTKQSAAESRRALLLPVRCARLLGARLDARSPE